MSNAGMTGIPASVNLKMLPIPAGATTQSQAFTPGVSFDSSILISVTRRTHHCARFQSQQRRLSKYSRGRIRILNPSCALTTEWWRYPQSHGGRTRSADRVYGLASSLRSNECEMKHSLVLKGHLSERLLYRDSLRHLRL